VVKEAIRLGIVLLATPAGHKSEIEELAVVFVMSVLSLSDLLRESVVHGSKHIAYAAVESLFWLCSQLLEMTANAHHMLAF
jgi:hypothetical protein